MIDRFQAFFPGNKVQFTRADTLEAFGGGAGTVINATMLNATGCVADPTALLPCQQLLELAAPLKGARYVLSFNVFSPFCATSLSFSALPSPFKKKSLLGVVVVGRPWAWATDDCL